LKVTTQPIVLEVNEKVMNGSIHSFVESNPLSQQNGFSDKRKTNIYNDGRTFTSATQL